MRWGLLLAAYASLLVYGLLDNSRGPLFPDVLKGLDLSDSLGGLLFTTASAFGAVGGLGGRWVRRAASLAWTLRLGLVLFSAGACLLGGSDGLSGLLLGSAVLGVGMGLLSLAQAEAVARGSPPAAHRRVFAGLHAMYGVSSFLAPQVVGALSRAALGWQASFYGLALVPAAGLLATIGVEAPPPSEPVGELALAPVGDDGGLRRQVLFASILAAYCAGELALTTRLVLHAERLGWSSGEGQALLSGFFAGLLAGRLVVTLVPLGLTHRQLLVASGGLSAASALAGLLVHPLGLALTGLFMGPFYPTGQALLREAFPRSFEAAMGTALVVVAAVVMATHFGVGLASDHVTLARALLVVPLAQLVAVALALGSARR